MEKKYRRTLCASYIAFVCQALVINLTPLLFVIFQTEFDISITKIGVLVTYSFLVQLTVDFLSARFSEKMRYRPCVILAHVCRAIGLAGIGQFPYWLPDPYVGLLVAVTVCSVGGGLIEVLASPIVEALPLRNKASAMSLLHSFYAWGSALVVILSTVFLKLAGTAHWRLLPLLWAIVPACNAVLYAGAWIEASPKQGGRTVAGKLLCNKQFWLFAVLILCAGAAEQAIAQWASYFAETGLRVDKTVGDLLGPCLFAVLMGVCRVFYGMSGNRIPLIKFLLCSSVLCVAGYLLTALSPLPLLALAGCGVCGLAVGVMWPGVLSLAAERCPQSGIAMFAMLALAGDMGCTLGPAAVGVISGLFGGQLETGLLLSAGFPAIMIIVLVILKKDKA